MVQFFKRWFHHYTLDKAKREMKVNKRIYREGESSSLLSEPYYTSVDFDDSDEVYIFGPDNRWGK